MKEDKEELIWVDKEFAERFKKLKETQSTRDQQEKVFNEYMEKIKAQVRDDFKANLESLEEDAAMFTGLMLKVKQTFEKTKNEQLDASYALWEKFEAEIPSVIKKTAVIIAALSPLKRELEALDKLLERASTYNIDKLTEAIRNLSSLQGANKEIVEFIVKNYTQKVS